MPIALCIYMTKSYTSMYLYNYTYNCIAIRLYDYLTI